MPLCEAVSNAVHAIDDRFGDEAQNKGRIEVVINRRDDDDSRAIESFEVRDNGVGFNDENYNSFLTPDSMLKFSRGGKGIGRLGWLKVFGRIHLESTFKNGTALSTRHFDFIFDAEDQLKNESLAQAGTGAKQGTS